MAHVILPKQSIKSICFGQFYAFIRRVQIVCNDVCVCGAFPLFHAHESFPDRARKIDDDETFAGTIHVKCKLLNAVDCIRSSLICFILQ